MISIKDWNNLPDNKKKEAIEFLHSEIQNSELFKLLCGKYISSTAKLNAWLSWLKTFWDTHTPTQNCIYTLTGSAMGYPTGGNSNSDIVSIKAKYTAAGKTATFNINI